MRHIEEFKKQIVDLLIDLDLEEIKSEIKTMLKEEKNDDLRVALHSARIELIRIKLNERNDKIDKISKNVEINIENDNLIVPPEEDDFPWSKKNR